MPIGFWIGCCLVALVVILGKPLGLIAGVGLILVSLAVVATVLGVEAANRRGSDG